MFFIFRSSFSKNFGPFVFSGPDYCPSLLIPLLGFIGPFLLGPNESYGHVCVLVFVWELSFGLGLKWAFTPLGPLRVLFKGARTPPKPREVCNRRFENSSKNRSFFS